MSDKISVTDLIGKVFKKNKNSYVLTPLGQRKLENWDVQQQGYKLDVMVYLGDHDSSTIREISNNMRIPEKSVKYILQEMEDEGWVIQRNKMQGG